MVSYPNFLDKALRSDARKFKQMWGGGVRSRLKNKHFKFINVDFFHRKKLFL